MKTNYLTTFLLTILTLSVFGNDGVYLSRGSAIYSTQETKISLERENLSFTVRDKIAQVDIQFEFNNPENKERKLLVGFQAPSAVGDVTDETCNKILISDFRILKDGEILPYQLKAAQCADCELKEPKEFHFSQKETGVFVYLFEVDFKPGINRINHSYSFPASNNVVFDEIYNYILTTGSKWAGRTIKDLTVQIDMGTNRYFFVHNIFGLNANWSILGTGKVTNTKFSHFEADSCRMVRVLSGKLQIEVKDFHPTKNIEFGIISENSFINRTTDLARIQSGELLEIGQLNKDKTYSKEELRILRNTVYAQHGYAFKSTDLQDFFSQFEWYLPDPNLNMDQIALTEKEKSFLDEILKKENQ
jgi:hypothetical protein